MYLTEMSFTIRQVAIYDFLINSETKTDTAGSDQDTPVVDRPGGAEMN